MKSILICLTFLYATTGAMISIKLFKNILGKLIGAVYFGILWLPLLIADLIVERMKEE